MVRIRLIREGMTTVDGRYINPGALEWPDGRPGSALYNGHNSGSTAVRRGERSSEPQAKAQRLHELPGL